jgi:hypothetical protein
LTCNDDIAPTLVNIFPLNCLKILSYNSLGIVHGSRKVRQAV